MISSGMPVVITPSVLANTMVNGLTNDQANLAVTEQQVSTGDAINVASDNPAGAASMLQLQGSVVRANQYAANAADGVGWLSLGNSTVSSVLSVVQSIKSVIEGVSGSSLMSDPATITSTAAQVQGALNQLLNLANTTEAGGQPIFAGTGSATAAYDANGNYLGNMTSPTRTVAPGTQVAVAVTGPTVFGSGATGLLGTGIGPTGGSTTPGVLQQTYEDLTNAAADLGSGNSAGAKALLSNVTGTDLTNLTTALNNVETAAGTLGANQQAVQGFATQATASVTALTGQLGAVQDTNMAQALTNLQLQQTAYQEALYATSQLSTDSLVKYL
jgi:flagellar hook-associated protein 3 FlgL